MVVARPPFLLLLLLALVSDARAARASLPATINAAYSGCTNESAVLHAARTGVNVLLWFSIQLIDGGGGQPAIAGGPDLACIANVSAILRAEGLPTVHMVTVGGWNAPHPTTAFSPAALFAAFLQWNQHVVARPGLESGFDGIDWDLEGNDDPRNQNNNISIAQLDTVGAFSQLAKASGLFVSLVPCESYLDPTRGGFDISLRHPYPEWHPEFLYHGLNPYALLLAKYALTRVGGEDVPTYDFVTVQLYESWSHANFNVTAGQSAAAYLTAWVPQLVQGWIVSFGAYPPAGLPTQRVAVPAAQLLIGLGNGWAGGAKSLLVMPAVVGEAWASLSAKGVTPRGVGWWCVEEEGAIPPGQTQPLFFAQGLNSFLKGRAAL